MISYCQRLNSPKSGTDWRDIAMLLLTFPEIKEYPDTVKDRLRDIGASPEILEIWKKLAASDIQAADEDDEF